MQGRQQQDMAHEARRQAEAQREEAAQAANELATKRCRLLLSLLFGMAQVMKGEAVEAGFDEADKFMASMAKQGYSAKDLLG